MLGGESALGIQTKLNAALARLLRQPQLMVGRWRFQVPSYTWEDFLHKEVIAGREVTIDGNSYMAVVIMKRASAQAEPEPCFELWASMNPRNLGDSGESYRILPIANYNDVQRFLAGEGSWTQDDEYH